MKLNLHMCHNIKMDLRIPVVFRLCHR